VRRCAKGRQPHSAESWVLHLNASRMRQSQMFTAPHRTRRRPPHRAGVDVVVVLDYKRPRRRQHVDSWAELPAGAAGQGLVRPHLFRPSHGMLLHVGPPVSDLGGQRSLGGHRLWHVAEAVRILQPRPAPPQPPWVSTSAVETRSRAQRTYALSVVSLRNRATRSARRIGAVAVLARRTASQSSR
jgi:hypothetical protein